MRDVEIGAFTARALTEEEIAANRAAAAFYCREAAEYAE